MNKEFICYFDMDGVLNLFEADKNARTNMWLPGYFITIPARTGMNELLMRLNKKASVKILSKIIQKDGVIEEKNIFLQNNYSSDSYDEVIYVPYNRSKADYIDTSIPSMLVDDKEANLDECEGKGCRCLFFSDAKISRKYPNVQTPQEIYEFFEQLI